MGQNAKNSTQRVFLDTIENSSLTKLALIGMDNLIARPYCSMLSKTHDSQAVYIQCTQHNSNRTWHFCGQSHEKRMKSFKLVWLLLILLLQDL